MKSIRVQLLSMGTSIGLCAAVGIVLGAASKSGFMALRWCRCGRGFGSRIDAV